MTDTNKLVEEKINYREMQAHLDELVAKLQSGEGDIDELLDSYKQALSVISKIEKYLENAKNEIEHLKKTA